MINDIQFFSTLMVDGFLRILPYVLLTIPIAVAVNVSGAAKHIRKAFAARPIPAIVLATLVGAFSPFCSCGVIPVVASLLIGGVPIAPVMTFWIASPSMDPEMFFLSVAMVGWDLALWRLTATLVLSLGAGLITHLAIQRGWITQPVLLSQIAERKSSLMSSLWSAAQRALSAFRRSSPTFATESCWAAPSATIPKPKTRSIERRAAATQTGPETGVGCSASPITDKTGDAFSGAPACTDSEPAFARRLLRESSSATFLVVKFMLLALVFEALFKMYIPKEWVVNVVGRNNPWAILTAALVGVPLYTSNLTALPMIGALLGQGMNASAALSFLIAGPTTTMPAMAAVWGLVRRKVFVLYVAFALIGAILMGLLHGVITSL